MINIFKDLIRYKSLIYALVVRHLSVRYRGSSLGFLWSFLNPLLLMLVYNLVFNHYIKVKTEYNYTLFVFAGLLPWLWTTSSLQEGVSALVSSGHLITKAMFPPHLLPLVTVLTNGFNFILSLILLLIFFLYFKVAITATWIVLPIIIFLHFIFLWGGVLFLSSLNVLYRDVQHLIAHFLQFMFFLCPIVYPLTNIPEGYRKYVLMNPFALFTVTYQRIFLESVSPSLYSVLYLSACAGLSFLIGVWVFNKNREKLAELL